MDNVQAYDAYDARADTISLDLITSDSQNRTILRRLQRNNADETNILYIRDHHDGESYTDYCPEGTYDMGWLGYFIGKNGHLQKLVIEPFEPPSGLSVRDVIVPFLKGVKCNTSIREIGFYFMDLLGGEMFTILTPFFKNNHNLTNITIMGCDFGDEGGRLLALAIGNCKHRFCTPGSCKSLQKLDLQDNNITEEGMVDIITSLSLHPHLEYLDFEGNHLRKIGCVALATLLRCSATELQYLDISNNEINDEGIEALVPALATCSHLEELQLFNNPSITTRGWQSLASILESPSCNLTMLNISCNNIDDGILAVFSSALMNNHTLKTLLLYDNPSITAGGLQAVSKVLCDTSSVNATFLSNHTLNYLGEEVRENAIIGPLLDLNDSDDKKEVATIKILQSHDDLDMLPFFEWEFKCLPIALRWLERASVYEMSDDFEQNIEERKLSTIYQFVRGLPLLYVETRLRKELEDIKAEESKLEEDFIRREHILQELLIEESQMEAMFDEEKRRLLQEFTQRKQYLQECKESIMKNLAIGGNFPDLKRKQYMVQISEHLMEAWRSGSLRVEDSADRVL